MRYKKLIDKPLEDALAVSKTILLALESKHMSPAGIYDLQVRLNKALTRINEIIAMEPDA